MKKVDRVGSKLLDNVTIGTEHQVQIGLVRALENVLQTGDCSGNAAEILEQLKVFTDAHFLSEQLLMRLHSYADYDKHCQEHDALLEALSAVQTSFDAQQLDERRSAVKAFGDSITRHIAGSDATLERFISQTGQS
jgi:hemerythrin